MTNAELQHTFKGVTIGALATACAAALALAVVVLYARVRGSGGR